MMPTLVWLNVGDGSDLWLRETIRLSGHTHDPAMQGVVVQDAREADRIVSAMQRLKMARGKPFGGARQERYLAAWEEGTADR